MASKKHSNGNGNKCGGNKGKYGGKLARRNPLLISRADARDLAESLICSRPGDHADMRLYTVSKVNEVRLRVVVLNETMLAIVDGNTYFDRRPGQQLYAVITYSLINGKLRQPSTEVFNKKQAIAYAASEIYDLHDPKGLGFKARRE